MEALRGDDFLRLAAGLGIGFDARYPDSRCLSILPPREQARFWVLPSDPVMWPHFVATLLHCLDEWHYGFLWPRAGKWPDPEKSHLYSERVRDVILRGVGIPAGWAGSIRFSRDEKDALLAATYAFLAFGRCVDDDLFFVPDHGRQLLQTDHHDVIHVECSSGERVQKLVDQMAEAGYELPTDPPDWTFVRPSWMRKEEQGARADRPGDGPPQ